MKGRNEGRELDGEGDGKEGMDERVGKWKCKKKGIRREETDERGERNYKTEGRGRQVKQRERKTTNNTHERATTKPNDRM